MTDAEYNNLTVDNKFTIKNTSSWWVDITCLQNGSGSGLLQIAEGIICLKDIAAEGGALMTDSLSGQTGGGAIFIGSGNYSTNTPPCIVMTNASFPTLYLFTNVISQAPANLNLGNLTVGGNTGSSIQPYISFINGYNGATRYICGWTNRIALSLANSSDYFSVEQDFGSEIVFGVDYYGNVSYWGNLNPQDSIDDIATLRSIKTTTDDNGNPIFDRTTLKFLQDPRGLYSLSACVGWELSIQQKFLAKHDAEEASISDLLNRVEALETKLGASNTTLS